MDNIERHLQRREAIREAANDRAFDKLEIQSSEADRLIGELCRGGSTVYYINQRSRSGRPTGRIVEGSRMELFSYLIRNRYI